MILILSFFVLISTTICSRDVLRGTWCNQRGSKMDVDCRNNEIFEGRYNRIFKPLEIPGYPAIKVYDDNQWFDLNGVCIEKNYTIMVGFSVRWINEKMNVNSITTWNGVLNKEGNIETSWLLVDGYSDLWTNTRIGKDVFYKCDP